MAQADKPTVLVTRRLPDAVHARLERDYDARLNPEDRLYDKDALIAAAQGADAILPCHTEHFTEDVFAGLPDSVKIIANFSVGYEAMQNGDYWGSIYQSPVDDAEAALQTAIDVLDGKDVPFLNYFDTPKITQDNMDEFTKPVF